MFVWVCFWFLMCFWIGKRCCGWWVVRCCLLMRWGRFCDVGCWVKVLDCVIYCCIRLSLYVWWWSCVFCWVWWWDLWYVIGCGFWVVGGWCFWRVNCVVWLWCFWVVVGFDGLSGVGFCVWWWLWWFVLFWVVLMCCGYCEVCWWVLWCYCDVRGCIRCVVFFCWCGVVGS